MILPDSSWAHGSVYLEDIDSFSIFQEPKVCGEFVAECFHRSSPDIIPGAAENTV